MILLGCKNIQFFSSIIIYWCTYSHSRIQLSTFFLNFGKFPYKRRRTVENGDLRESMNNNEERHIFMCQYLKNRKKIAAIGGTFLTKYWRTYANMCVKKLCWKFYSFFVDFYWKIPKRFRTFFMWSKIFHWKNQDFEILYTTYSIIFFL